MSVESDIDVVLHVLCLELGRRNPFPFGEDIGNMTMDQLISLEKHLDMWMSHIRTSKVTEQSKSIPISFKIHFFDLCKLQTKIMFEEIQLLKHKVSWLIMSLIIF